MLKSIVPVAVGELTVAVKVTFCPTSEGLMSLTRPTVGAIMSTTCDRGVAELAMNAALPG